MITKVVVNHAERNYFDDYSELRSDTMTYVDAKKVCKAIDKLVRRYRNNLKCDCLLVENDDGTGWRLWYAYDEKHFDPKTSRKELRLRHFTSWEHQGWDTEEAVTVAQAKRRILGI